MVIHCLKKVKLKEEEDKEEKENLYLNPSAVVAKWSSDKIALALSFWKV